MKTLSQCGGSSAGQSSGFLNRFFPYGGRLVANFFANSGLVRLVDMAARVAVVSTVLAVCAQAGETETIMVPADFAAKAAACGGLIYPIADTKSMEPTLTARSVVIVRKAKFSEVKLGEIVVFTDSAGEMVCHRVVAKGTRGWITKGDNNAEADPGFLARSNFVGLVAGVHHR